MQKYNLKNGQKDVWSIENNRYKDAYHEKQEIALALANISSLDKRDML